MQSSEVILIAIGIWTQLQQAEARLVVLYADK